MTKHYLHTYDPQALGNLFLGLECSPQVSAAFDPDSLTDLAVNFGFTAANCTVDGSNRIAKVTNLGTLDIALIQGTDANKPVLSAAGATFDSTDTMASRNDANDADVLLSDIFSASAGWVLAVATVTEANLADGTVYLNDAIWSATTDQTPGVNVKSGDTAHATNFTTAAQQAEFATGVIDGLHIFVWKHASGTLSGQLDDGTPATAASGNTDATIMARTLQVGKSIGMVLKRILMHSTVPADEADIIANLMTHYEIA